MLAESASWSPCASSWTNLDVQMQDHTAHGRLVSPSPKVWCCIRDCEYLLVLSRPKHELLVKLQTPRQLSA